MDVNRSVKGVRTDEETDHCLKTNSLKRKVLRLPQRGHIGSKGTTVNLQTPGRLRVKTYKRYKKVEDHKNLKCRYTPPHSDKITICKSP